MSFTGTVPAHGAPQPYHCRQADSCLDELSVFDLTPTSDRTVCEGLHGTFGRGPCPVDRVVGHCVLRENNMASTRVFYAPLTAVQAKAACEQQYEGTFSPG